LYVLLVLNKYKNFANDTNYPFNNDFFFQQLGSGLQLIMEHIFSGKSYVPNLALVNHHQVSEFKLYEQILINGTETLQWQGYYPCLYPLLLI
jgi:hypothetical protein